MQEGLVSSVMLVAVLVAVPVAVAVAGAACWVVTLRAAVAERAPQPRLVRHPELLSHPGLGSPGVEGAGGGAAAQLCRAPPVEVGSDVRVPVPRRLDGAPVHVDGARVAV